MRPCRPIVGISSLVVLTLLVVAFVGVVEAFLWQLTTNHYHQHHSRPTFGTTTTTNQKLQQVQLPATLLRSSNTNELALYEWTDDTVLFPLPSGGLSDELRTCSLYQLPEQSQSQSHMLQVLLSHQNNNNKQTTQTFGCVRGPASIGKVGCMVEVVAMAMAGMDDSSNSITTRNNTSTMLVRGVRPFRIVVIVQEIPYTVALVEEEESVYDKDDNGDDTSTEWLPSDDETDDDDFTNLSERELVSRTVHTVTQLLQTRLEQIAATEVSPLESAILQEQIGIDPHWQQEAATRVAQEKLAVWEAFAAGGQPPHDVCWSELPYLATELCDDSPDNNDVRQWLLETQSLRQRLLLACRHSHESLGMLRARQVATSITDQADEKSKDLTVGIPTLPPWAVSIAKGTAVEYFWNKEYGWCRGIVVNVEEPQQRKEMDKTILWTIQFDDDNSIHTIPFRADEKARWRPAR